MMTPDFSHEEFDLYFSPIVSDSGLIRRERERATALLLVRKKFGDTAEIAHRPDGAPYIPQMEDTCISISHDADMCVLAVSRNGKSIGVDIETARPQLLRVRHKFLSESESRWIQTAGLTDRALLTYLLKCWTAKEAVYKCARTPGLGLTEIVTAPDHESATARGEEFRLIYIDGKEGEALTAIALKSKP